MKNGKKVKLLNPAKMDEQGRHVIRLNVTNDSDFLSPFSADGCPVISGDTAEFLSNSIKHQLPQSRFNLVISSNEIDERERVLYKRAIKNYYQSEYAETQRELRKNAIQSLIMVIIAAVVFSIAILLENLTNIKVVFLNMLDVCAWVFMWEGVDLFFFRRSDMRKQQHRNLSLMNAEITFVDKT